MLCFYRMKKLKDFADLMWIWGPVQPVPRICPCCAQPVSGKNTKIVREIDFHPPGVDKKLRLDFEDLFRAMPNYLGIYSPFFEWACDRCLKTKIALIGNPDLQLWHLNGPHLSYYDRQWSCGACRNSTIHFSREHQRYLYEELGLWVMTVPRCKLCQSKRNLNTELSELLREKEFLDFKKATRVAEIYAEMGKMEKVKEYNAKASKLKI